MNESFDALGYNLQELENLVFGVIDPGTKPADECKADGCKGGCSGGCYSCKPKCANGGQYS